MMWRPLLSSPASLECKAGKCEARRRFRVSCWGGSSRVRPRANTVLVRKRRKPYATQLEGHVEIFKICFYILWEHCNAFMKSVIQVKDTCGRNECFLILPVTTSQRREKKVLVFCCLWWLFFRLWDPAVSCHALHILQNFLSLIIGIIIRFKEICIHMMYTS